MIRIFRVAVMLCPFFLVLGTPCFSGDNTAVRSAVDTVKSDFETFYLEKPNLVRLGIGIGVAGVFSNTNMDQAIRDWYQEDVRRKGTDDVSRTIEKIGLAYFTCPIYVGVYGVGSLYRNPTMEGWAQRSLRATLVGTPTLLVLQPLLGGPRPSVGNSRWKPFQENHGVSGHTFIGAVPFITAAKMSENIFWKAAFYGLSTMIGISRINDDEHYFSQAALGWFLAYLSCDVVEKVSNQRARQVPVGLMILPTGAAITFRF